MKNYTIKARPTVHRGIKMRSRLEARFAAWMDDNGYVWQYEPWSLSSRSGKWLPDFMVESTHRPGHRRFVELKPSWEFVSLELVNRAQAAVREHNPDDDVLFVWPGEGRWQGFLLRSDGPAEFIYIATAAVVA